MSGPLSGERLVIAHLFPELLNLYGDRGNVRTLVQRARWRGMDVRVLPVGADADNGPTDADIVFVGGGPDRQQVAVATGLERLDRWLRDVIGAGAALLAVCGGYQNLGHAYRSPLVGELPGPGILDVSTEAPPGAQRMVGGVVVELDADSPISALGRRAAASAGFPGEEHTIVGFENHSGRTYLGDGVRALGLVSGGHGNNGSDGSEGAIWLPGEGGPAGLRVGTYLHGPLLPRNPHLADFILSTALRHRGIDDLAPLADDAEWAAHAAYVATWQSTRINGGGRAEASVARAASQSPDRRLAAPGSRAS